MTARDAPPGPDAGVRLRPLERADLDRVLELEPELFGRGAWSRVAYESELELDDRRYVAAIGTDGELVGWAGIALADEASVMTVGVAPGARRRGIGTLLLGALLDEARAARARQVFLEVRASDAGAQALYSRAGFEPVGLRRGYYSAEGEDAVVMCLSLVRRAGPVGADALSPPW